MLDNDENESNLGAYKSAWGVGGGRGGGRKNREGEGFGWRKGGRWKEGVVVEGWVSFFSWATQGALIVFYIVRTMHFADVFKQGLVSSNFLSFFEPF